MQSYNRLAQRKLTSLRLILLLLLLGSLLAFNTKLENLGYTIVVALLFLSLIKLQDITVSQEKLRISKFYFFGLIKREWFLSKGQLVDIIPLGSEFGQTADPPSAEFDVGCILTLLALLIPYKVRKREFIIKIYKEQKRSIENLMITLEKHEFITIESFVNSSHST